MSGRMLVFALLGLAACEPYNVHRAALGPHPEPVMYSAAPSEGVAELGFGASSVAHFMHIEKGNPETAVEVPGTQVRADARFQLGDVVALGFSYENGISATSQKPSTTQPDVDNGDVQGFGMLADVSIKTKNPNLFVGLHFDMTIWQVPWVEYDSSTDPNFPWTIVQHGKQSVATSAFAIVPTYRSGKLTWFGGLTARQHPTIQEKDLEFVGDLDGDVHSGPFNLILSAGLEAELGSTVKGSVVVYQDMTQDPNKYGPALGAMVIVPLGHRHKAPAAAPPPPPAPPTTTPPVVAPPPPPPPPPASGPP